MIEDSAWKTGLIKEREKKGEKVNSVARVTFKGRRKKREKNWRKKKAQINTDSLRGM